MVDLDLNPQEQTVLDGSFDPDKTMRATKLVLVSGLIALPCPFVLGYFTKSWVAVAALASLYVVITVREKVGFGFGVLLYKSVIRKLHERLEAS